MLKIYLSTNILARCQELTTQPHTCGMMRMDIVVCVYFVSIFETSPELTLKHHGEKRKQRSKLLVYLCYCGESMSINGESMFVTDN